MPHVSRPLAWSLIEADAPMLLRLMVTNMWVLTSLRGSCQCVLLCLAKVWVSVCLSWAGALTTGLQGGSGNTEQTLCQPPASQAVWPSQGWHSPGSHGQRQQPQPALASPQPCPVTHHTQHRRKHRCRPRLFSQPPHHFLRPSLSSFLIDVTMMLL